MTAPAPSRISRDDIESKIRELTDPVNEQAESARDQVRTFAIVAAVVVLIGVFFVGHRRGKKTTTVVEVRRF